MGELDGTSLGSPQHNLLLFLNLLGVGGGRCLLLAGLHVLQTHQGQSAGRLREVRVVLLCWL